MISATSRARKAATLIAIVTSASLINPGPAHAACAQWNLRGDFSIHQSNGLRVDIHRWWGATAKPAQATLYLADGTPAQVNNDGQPVQHGNHSSLSVVTFDQTGLVNGEIAGKHMDFTVKWDWVQPPLSNHYTGTIADNGVGASGETVNNRGTGDTWSTPETFVCAT